MGTKCAPASSKVMCEWSDKLNTKKYVFGTCPGIVLSIVVTFLAEQKKLIYYNTSAPCPTLPEGWLFKL